MLAHQRHPRGNPLIKEYLARDFRQPKDFASFLYIGQLLQARVIAFAAETIAAVMGFNWGSLYWQLDDCWPVASWSSIDYFGHWKALQFAARRFYSEILLSAHEEDGGLAFYGVSDRTAAAKAKLRVRVLDFDGKAVFEKTSDVEIAPVTSRVYAKYSDSELLGSASPTSVYVVADLAIDGKVVSTSRYLFQAVQGAGASATSRNDRGQRLEGRFHDRRRVERLGAGGVPSDRRLGCDVR